MLTRFLRPRPDGGATGAAPVAAIPTNDVTGDAPIDRIVPQEEGTPSSISDASRAFRERLERIATQPETPDAPVVEGQPRNEKGQFASPAPAAEAPDGVIPPAVDPATGDAPPAADDPAPEDAPQLFVLKGEEQRGESDIELDISGLPPEVVERLERAQKQGMRAAEFKQEMQKVRTLRSDLDAVETEIRVDPEGFVLNRVPPVTRAKIAETLLLEHWDALAPTIEQLWNDDAGRMRKLTDAKSGIDSRRNDVMASVTATRSAADIRAAISDMIPENTADADAQEFFASSVSILQQKALNNDRVTVADVPALLAAHRRRFFGAGEPAPTTPPARPKLAVRTPSPKSAADAPSARTVVPADDVAARIRARTAALNTAPQGAGAAAVQRPGGPANETIEQASRRLRGQAPRSA